MLNNLLGDPIVYYAVALQEPCKMCAKARCVYMSICILLLNYQPEIREFPKAFSRFATTAISISNTVTAGLENCVNLRSCTWTRDGSLNSSILQAIQKCTKLQELEINGHSEGNYDPDILLQFTTLRKLSLIMPSAPTIDTLSPWLRTSGTSLLSLTLICKVSALLSPISC
jgi:hypothetical protein